MIEKQAVESQFINTQTQEVSIIEPYTQVSALSDTPGIGIGQYFRIKSAETGYYITMAANSDADGIGVSMSTRSNSLSQQFMLVYYGNATFGLRPRTTSSRGLGASSAAAQTIGTAITLQSTSSYKKLRITRAANGYYRISLSNSTDGYAIRSRTNSLSSDLCIKNAYNTNCDVWVFEPVCDGEFRYYAATQLGNEDTNWKNAVIGDFTYMGYSTSFMDRPTTAGIQSTFHIPRSVVFHGHGYPGYLRLDANPDTGTTEDKIYSENPPGNTASFASIPATLMNSKDYVFIIACQSGTGVPGYRRSLAEAIYAFGASCVTGFSCDVAGGGQYFARVSMAMSYHNACTIQYALEYADSFYSPTQQSVPGCPGNPNHRVTYGNMNKTLDMTEGV